MENQNLGWGKSKPHAGGRTEKRGPLKKVPVLKTRIEKKFRLRRLKTDMLNFNGPLLHETKKGHLRRGKKRKRRNRK